MQTVAVPAAWKDNARKFLALRSDQDLCSLLGASIRQVQRHLDEPAYHRFGIAKKRGGSRSILAPNEDLKKIQRRLNHYLQAVYAQIKPAAVHGYIKCPGRGEKARNVISNASMHVNKRYLLHIDLCNFFDAISDKMVYKTLLSLGMEKRQAAFFTLLSTFEKKLPTGAPGSPVLSNLVCLDLDKALTEYCAARNITYTRYADDLSFSANEEFLPEDITALSTVINRFGFQVNGKKLRRQKHNQRQVVTGLVVNRKVNVDRRYRKPLRAVLHDIELNGVEVAAGRYLGRGADVEKFKSSLSGQSNWIRQTQRKNINCG